MKLPFFRYRKLNNIVSEENTSKDNTIEDKVITEKELLLGRLNSQQLETLFFRTGLDKNSISLEFVKKLINIPALFNYLIDNFVDNEIIKKINDNNLRISDIKHYNKDIFLYDIFSDEDKNLLEVLRKNINISNMGYATFSLEEFENVINSNNYIDINIDSLIDDVSLFIERKKALPLPYNNFYGSDDISIFLPIDNDKVFCENIFDYYYSNDLSYTKDTILFISYDKFLEWINDEDRKKILETVQVVINDDYIKSNNIRFNIKNFRSDYNLLRNNNDYHDKILIKVNHLLYLVENSKLDNQLKDYYKYYISKYFLSSNKETFSYNTYFYEGKLKKLANEIKTKLDDESIIKNTKDFNDLNIEEKEKNVEQPKFSAEIFLRQFSNLDEIKPFNFLNYITALNKEEKNIVLSNDTVINKLKGLLKDNSYDEYHRYEEICKKLSVSEIFKIFDSEFIKSFYDTNRDLYQYRFFHTLMESNINEVLNYLLDDEEYFREFIKDIGKYTFNNVNYDLAFKMIKKMEKDNLDIDFIHSFDEVVQFKLLKEDFSNDYLVKIVKNASKNVQQFFYLEDNRFVYLWDKFNILNLSRANYKFNDDVVSKKEFFDRFKSTSMIQFRINVDQFLIHQPDIFFEDKITKYEDELISNFDIESGLFVQYKYLLDNISLLDDRRFAQQGIDFFYDANTNLECRQLRCIGYDEDDKIFIKDKEKITNYLKWLSKRKLNEIIIDRLFKDNIYNVFLNIKEMLRYNKGLSIEEKVLDMEQEKFYQSILNIDNLDSKVILEIYHKFKDKNVALMFYEDMNKLKNKSYDKIKEDMFQPEDSKYIEDKELSNKYSVPVFDLRDKNYVMLVRCLGSTYSNLTHHKRDCYTILSNDNPSVFRDDDYIYGYSSFDNDCILHIFEGDSFSGDVKDSDLSTGSDRVNRIMTSHEIATNSYWYSEVQIVNKKNSEEPSIFETLRPSFLVVYDKINDEILEEAKRMNIPICIINKSLNKDVVKEFSAFDAKEELSYTSEWGMVNENDRRKNR